MICSYGCNQEAKFQLKNKKWCCSIKSNSCPEIRRKNSEGSKNCYKNGRNLNFGGSKEKGDELRKKSHESHIEKLKQRPFEQWGKKLKCDLILKEQDFKCCHCKIEKFWNSKPLTFELDHINGDKQNNKRENLRLLCPNCHSQTDTWRGRGGGKYKTIKIEEEKIVEKLEELKSIYQTIIYFEYAPTKGIYDRFYKIIRKYKLETIVFEDNINAKIVNKIKIQKEEQIANLNKLTIELKNKEKELIEKTRKIKIVAQSEFKEKDQRRIKEKNSQFGTCWIYNLKLKENKKIKIQEIKFWEKEGWEKGRKQKFDKGNSESKRLIATIDKTWISNVQTKETKFIKEQKSLEYLRNGWIKGRINFKSI